jgi:hypothetical protein
MIGEFMTETNETNETTETTETEIADVIMRFELTMEEANLILAALQELPHKTVNSLIQKMVQQGNAQVPE